MSEYITKTEYLKDQVSLKEQRLADFKESKSDRHSVANKTQTIISQLDRKVDEQEKININFVNDMNTVKKDIKEGFQRFETKLEEKFEVMFDKFATKLEVQKVKSDTDSNSAIIKWVIGVATTIFTAGIIFLLTR